MIEHLLAITLAYVIDRVIGDPKSLPHPVQLIGKMIAFLDKTFNRGKFRRLKGSFVVVFIVLFVTFTAFVITHFAYQVHFAAGIVVESFLIATTIAVKGLHDAAYDVYLPLNNQQLQIAREKVGMIVGRDTDQLSESEIARATVETVAENTSDGVTAPLFWALIGGAPLAFMYRTINTCDSMLGYKNERYAQFGWAAARIDDLVNLIPSRITGIVMVFANQPVKPHSRRDCFRILFRDARKHSSPNSGWLEAATAGLLGVRLGGVNTYQGIVSKRAYLGEQVYRLEAKHIAQAVSVMHRAVIATIILFWIGGGMIAFASTWLKSGLFI